MGIANKLFFLIGFISVSLWLSACSVQEEAAASGNSLTGDDETTVDNGEVGQDIDVEDFKVSFDTSTEYTMQWSADSDNNFSVSSTEYGSECIGTEGNRIQCILDMDELDIWTHDITMNIELPGTMCAYLGQYMYHFAGAKVGTPPSAVYYLEDPESGDKSGVKFCFPGSSCVYNPASPNASTGVYDQGDSPIVNRSSAAWDFNNDKGIRCPYDYSILKSSYPNCCIGSYIPVAVNSLDLTDIEYGDPIDWGGDLSSCFFGGGMRDALSKVSAGPFSGMPYYHITEVIGNGYGTEYTVPKYPYISSDFVNLFTANYFNPSDHTDPSETCPAVSNQVSNGPASCPGPSGGLSVLPDSDTFAQEEIYGWPFYTFDCLDNNLEVVARIDVMIREWNTRGELAKKASGNPDITGAEDAPFTPLVKNDYCDWKDFSDDEALCGVLRSTNWQNGGGLLESTSN